MVHRVPNGIALQIYPDGRNAGRGVAGSGKGGARLPGRRRAQEIRPEAGIGSTGCRRRPHSRCFSSTPLLGLSLASIFLVYTGASITRVLFISAATFGAMSLYGHTPQRI
jgi:hypothetical protein